MPVDPDKLRDELRQIGDRREDLDLARERLARDTRKAVRRARRVKGISMGEVAKLVGLDRTSLYQSYSAGR